MRNALATEESAQVCQNCYVTVTSLLRAIDEGRFLGDATAGQKWADLFFCLTGLRDHHFLAYFPELGINEFQQLKNEYNSGNIGPASNSLNASEASRSLSAKNKISVGGAL